MRSCESTPQWWVLCELQQPHRDSTLPVGLDRPLLSSFSSSSPPLWDRSWHPGLWSQCLHHHAEAPWPDRPKWGFWQSLHQDLGGQISRLSSGWVFPWSPCHRCQSGGCTNWCLLRQTSLGITDSASAVRTKSKTPGGWRHSKPKRIEHNYFSLESWARKVSKRPQVQWTWKYSMPMQSLFIPTIKNVHLQAIHSLHHWPVLLSLSEA